MLYLSGSFYAIIAILCCLVGTSLTFSEQWHNASFNILGFIIVIIMAACWPILVIGWLITLAARAVLAHISLHGSTGGMVHR
jgi:hypothetical protein